jgi:proteasome lid subunit RPN8/RPN11
MNKLTFVLLFALSSLRAVFAVPQPVAEKIDELGKRGDHIQFGQVRVFHSHPVHDADPSTRRQQFSIRTPLQLVISVNYTPSPFPP